MDRHDYIRKIFKISEKYNHTPDIEQTAIYIADQYYYENYKILAYVSSILAAKLHKRGFWQLQKAAYLLDCDLFKLEKDIVKKLNYQLYHKHFLCDVGLLTDKPLSVDFTIISRYISWYQIEANFYTIILAVQIMRKKLFKFSKVYTLLKLVSKKYDIDMKDLIFEYNQLTKFL